MHPYHKFLARPFTYAPAHRNHPAQHVTAHDAHPLDSSTSLWHTMAHDTPAPAAPHLLHMDIHEHMYTHAYGHTHETATRSSFSPNLCACSLLPYQHNMATITHRHHPHSFPAAVLVLTSTFTVIPAHPFTTLAMTSNTLLSTMTTWPCNPILTLIRPP